MPEGEKIRCTALHFTAPLGSDSSAHSRRVVGVLYPNRDHALDGRLHTVWGGRGVGGRGVE
jgi:hypothetical protein